jgi:3-oxoacyl-[acyl-carrier protein] reductase
MTPDYFKDKTILITGAGSGIGRASALVFAREGANVVCSDIDEAAAKRVADQVIQLGAEASHVTCDVTKRPAVDAMVAHAIERFGRVDFELNSAGAALSRKPFLEISEELWDMSYDLNVKGTFNCAQAIIPHMLDQGGGVIVNLASIAIKMGGAGNSVHYASSKGAVHVMTTGIGREFAGRGIRCLSISPGPVDTPFHAETPPELLEFFKEQVPMGRLATAEEIAETVLFACSEGAAYMTADTIFVSGGMR